MAYTNVTLNYDIGVLVGNFCGPAIVNISGNYFTYGRYIGLEVRNHTKVSFTLA